MPILDSENSSTEKIPIHFKFTNLESDIEAHFLNYMETKSIFISISSCVQKANWDLTETEYPCITK